MTYRITFVHKDSRFNPYEQITHLGGTSGGPESRPWKISQQAAIRGIETGQWSFYINSGNRQINVVVGINRFGKKYLKTQADANEPDRLLSLPDCC